jgi:hypothetical protein
MFVARLFPRSPVYFTSSSKEANDVGCTPELSTGLIARCLISRKASNSHLSKVLDQWKYVGTLSLSWLTLLCLVVGKVNHRRRLGGILGANITGGH